MSSDRLEINRAFGWGVLFVTDADDADIENLTLGSAISSGDRCVAIPVRHAQDVDLDLGSSPGDQIKPFEVSVTVAAQGNEETAADFEGIIAVPSGRLSIGDADYEQIVGVAAGLVRVRVSIEPDHHAERVSIEYTSL